MNKTLSLAIPYPLETRYVVLTYFGTELARVTKSDHAPSVQLIRPNGGEFLEGNGTYTVTWESNDVDGDALHFINSYSVDQGTTWLPLAIDVTGNSLEVDSRYLPGSTNALFKVTASDQMNIGEDITNAFFQVERKGPEAFILLPEKQITIPPNTPLFFQGYAYDLEDQVVEDNNLSWKSDIDGNLAVGKTLFTTLSPGTHSIEFAAKDKDGNVAIDQMRVFIGYKTFLPLNTK